MTEAQTIADLAVEAAGKAVIITTRKGREFLVLPDGQHKDVSEPYTIAHDLPDHVMQAVTLQTADSVVDYVNRYGTVDTVLFADVDTDTIVGVLDYHASGVAMPDVSAPDVAVSAAATANHADHKATLRLPRSMEWKCWTGIDGKLMGQLEFARFLEENAADVVAPSGADLLEACRDLQAVRKVNFTKAVRTDSDNENFEYVDETKASTRGGVEVPTKFKLEIPVYFGSRNVELFAFLRWRLDDAELKLGIALHRAEHVRQAMFQEIVQDVALRTSRQAVFGKLD